MFSITQQQSGVWRWEKDTQVSDQTRVQKQIHINRAVWSLTSVLKQFSRERTVFSTNADGTTGRPHANSWTWPLTITANGSHINVKHKTKMFTRKQDNIFVTQHSTEFLDMMPKASSIKEKYDKLDFIKIKNIWSAEDSVRRMKTPATDWEKYPQTTHPT